MQALTADESSQRGGGQVEQVFTHAVNLLIPGKPGLLTLLCETSDNAPNSCRLALTHFDNLLRPESVRFTDSGIYIGDNTWIDIHRCERWQTPQAVLNAATFSQIAGDDGATLSLRSYMRMTRYFSIAATILLSRDAS